MFQVPDVCLEVDVRARPFGKADGQYGPLIVYRING